MRRAVVVSSAVAALAAVLLAGCAASPAQPEPQGPAVEELRIGLTEWEIVLGADAVLPGEVRVEVLNSGTTDHDLIVIGERGTWRTPILDPGEEATLVLETTPGETLVLVCTVDAHSDHGMRTSLAVGER